MALPTEKVVVMTSGTVEDSYTGDPLEAWTLPSGATWTTPPVDRPVWTLAPLEPRPSDEPVQATRNAVVSGFTAYLPAGDPITPRNRVLARGDVYHVMGEPANWVVGVVVQLRRVEG